jgi:small-conductance mechanosensitive channel
MAALAFALSAGLTGLPSARAQDPEPKPEVAAPAEPKEITTADFAIEANAVEDRLSRIRTELSFIDIAAEVNQALDAIEAQGADLQEQFDALETRRMMSSELNTLRAHLELLDARTDRQIGKLSVYGGELEKLSTQNEQDIEVWTRAVRAARRPSVPKSVRDRTASILQGLREGKKELDKKLGEVLALQSRALDVRDRVRMAEQGVVDEEAAREGYDIRFSWPAVEDHLQAEGEALLVPLFLVLFLGWLFVRVRAVLADRIEGRQQDGATPWEDQAIEALRHPWRVVDMIVLTWVISLPLWFVVYKEMVPASFRNALVALGLLGTLHIVVTLVSGHPGVERALLLVELLLAGAGAAWLIRFLRNLEVPKRTRQGLWFSATSFWARLSLLICLVGAGATVLGYTYFAAEAAMVAIIGTIAATACMALARIVEAVVSTAVYAGRLDAFRMIRANREVTAKELGRVIRVLAAVLFVWALTDMTSSWRPLGRAVGGALSTDLGVGLVETGVTLGDFFAFFIVLWVSWMIARLVSFVLQEEILPRLHMQQGVPFALTTFTRYAIIVIGFVSAISILGVSLDRVTIVMSALGVGIGFGLQGLVNNVVSGFVLLTERPIRLRDKVEIEGVLGNVSNIGIRASTIRTFDGAEVIVPNGDLTSQRVVNWTLSARRQRVTIPVGVAYGTDPKQVLGILKKLAADNAKVFKTPAPQTSWTYPAQ